MWVECWYLLVAYLYMYITETKHIQCVTITATHVRGTSACMVLKKKNRQVPGKCARRLLHVGGFIEVFVRNKCKTGTNLSDTKDNISENLQGCFGGRILKGSTNFIYSKPALSTT